MSNIDSLLLVLGILGVNNGSSKLELSVVKNWISVCIALLITILRLL